MYLVYQKCVQSSYRYENILQIREVLGNHIDAKIFPKAASEKAQTTVSENRYTSPKINVFRTAILTLIATTGDNARASFLVHQVPRTSATVWQYRRMFTHFFPPRLSVRVYLSSDNCLSRNVWTPEMYGPPVQLFRNIWTPSEVFGPRE